LVEARASNERAEVAVRTKAKSSDSMSALRPGVNAGAPEDAASGAAPSSCVPSFDPGPLNDLKAVMDAVKFIALVNHLTRGLEARLVRLAELLDGSSWAEAAQGAHDIVSVAGNVGAMRLSVLARNLEHLCKSGGDPKRRSASAALRSEAIEAMRALKGYQSAF
jgi:HPt (histidine-containing phosphotransfer) domain-containing protein